MEIPEDEDDPDRYSDCSTLDLPPGWDEAFKELLSDTSSWFAWIQVAGFKNHMPIQL